jgi:hypothetical protein
MRMGTTVAKMNISIPDELRQQMQSHDNAFNWSNLAAEAFKSAVDNAEYLASIKSTVKRRIMATEVQDIASVERKAKSDGQKWAENHARMIELRNLNRHVEKQDSIDFGSWETVVRVIVGEEAAVADFRDGWVGPRSQFGSGVVEAYEENYANAFVEGALEVLVQIDNDE